MADDQILTEKMQQLCRRILQTARNELYINMRFLDAALCSFPYCMDPSFPPDPADTGTAIGTDGHMIVFHPRYLGALYRESPVQVNRAYFHMLLHCLFHHIVMPRPAGDLYWDLACDITAESITDTLYVKSLRTSRSWLRRETYRRLQEEHRVLTPPLVHRSLGNWNLGEQALAELRREFTIDNHCLWPNSDDPETTSSLRQKWEDLSEQMETDLETFSKESASDSGNLLDMLRVENRQRYDYREFLRRFSIWKEETRVDPDSFDYGFYSYGLELYGNMPLIEPQEWSEVQKIEEFVIVIDTSMSTSGELVKKFLEETYGILSENESFFRKINIHILQCDEQVQSHQHIADARQLQEYMEHLQLRGDGGTDFRPAFQYVNELIREGRLLRLRGLLYFTDGQGIYPTKMPPYETAFLFMEEDYEDQNVPPWAVKIVLNEPS